MSASTNAPADSVVAEIAATLDLMRHEVVPAARLREDFGAKKDDYFALQRSLELAFNFTIPLHQIDRWKTVGDVVAYVDGRVSLTR